MLRIYSIPIFLIIAALSGCASIKSTADYYFPYTTTVYPPKPEDYPIPILGRPPDHPYKTIGRLAFQSDEGWKFMRASMLYNAHIHGADAVLLNKADSRKEINYTQVPPRFDWIPAGGPLIVQGKNKKCYYTAYPNYIPVYEPGYIRRWTDLIISIDAEMIVFKK